MAEKKIYKLLMFLKRRPGMSLEEFRDYYENVHSKFGDTQTSGFRRYVRRYVEPLPNSVTGLNEEMEFDVVTEAWFDDPAAFQIAVDTVVYGKLTDELLKDEEHLFDRRRNRFATVVEYESVLSN